MTANQQRAMGIAEALIAEELQPADLTDDQWGLLLLAAGVSNRRLSPMVTAQRVLSQFYGRSGYFAGCTTTAAKIPMDQFQPSFYFG
jgi:sorbitol-specific phosphotransferase system component IIBC